MAAPLIGLLASVVALPTVVAGGIPAGVGIGAALIGYHLGQKHK